MDISAIMDQSACCYAYDGTENTPIKPLISEHTDSARPYEGNVYLGAWLKNFFEPRNILRLQKPFSKKVGSWFPRHCAMGGWMGGGCIPQVDWVK